MVDFEKLKLSPYDSAADKFLLIIVFALEYPLECFGISTAIISTILSFIALTFDWKLICYFGVGYIVLANFLSSIWLIKGIITVN
jgi:hypothetical protein